MRGVLVVIVVLLTWTGFTQKIQIVDEFHVGIIAVEVRYEHQVLYSNKHGEIILPNLPKETLVTFSAEIYKTQTIAFSKLPSVLVLEYKYQNLDELVLSASKKAEKRYRIPEYIARVSKTDIEQRLPQTSADLLATLPGVRVQKSQLGGGSPVIRGMESNRVLLVVDGIRLNNAIYRKGHLQNAITLSPLLLDRVEVVQGPSSVVYGSDALGGVVHYFTKELKTSSYFKNLNQAFVRYSTSNQEKTSSFSTYNSHKKWASYTAVSYSDFGDSRMGRNRWHGFQDWSTVNAYSQNTKTTYFASQTPNNKPYLQRNIGYSQFDVLQKLLFPLTQKTDLSFNIQYGTSSEIPNFGKLIETKGNQLKFARWSYGPQNRFLASSQIQIKDVNKKWLDEGKITLAYQNIQESRIQQKFNQQNRTTRKENVDVFSVNGDFFVPLSKHSKRDLSYGFEWVFNDVYSKARGEVFAVNGNQITGVTNFFPIQTRYPDGGSTYRSLAAYVNYRQDLDKKNTLNTGVRLTNTLLKAKWKDNQFVELPKSSVNNSNTAFTASIGNNYRPSKNSTVSVVFSSGFRSPNIDDIGKVREKQRRLTVPNIHLNPEFAYSGEVTLQHYAWQRRVNFLMNAYATVLDNYIIRAPVTDENSEIAFDGELFSGENLLTNTNQGQAYILGAVGSIAAKITPKLNTEANITYTRGIAVDSREPLSSIPPIFGHALLQYQQKKWNVVVRCDFNLKKKLKDYNTTEGIDNMNQVPQDANGNFVDLPAWYVWHINSSYKLNSGLEFQMQLQNVFDIHYKEFASLISAPGRNLVLSARYKF